MVAAECELRSGEALVTEHAGEQMEATPEPGKQAVEAKLLIFMTMTKGCCVPSKKRGGGSAQSQHSTRCASKWRRPQVRQMLCHVADGSATSQKKVKQQKSGAERI